jgi:phosphatidylglycerophosphatase A
MNFKKFSLFFCSGFGIGFFPIFPGTLASLIILLPIWHIKSQMEITFFFFLILIYTFLSFILIKVIIEDQEDKDPKYIVSDEYIGQAISLIFCKEQIIDYVISFLLFRILDILKPFPISYFDQKKNPFGVLMDDIVAGTIVALVFAFYYGT